MDLRQDVLVGLLLFSFILPGSCNLVFEVQHKFKGRERSLSAFRAHDFHRHGRLLADIDVALGGNGHPAKNGLFFTKIGLGSPPKDFYVQVDTGSDILWVNCIECTTCPKKSNIDVVEFALFNPKSSNTSELVNCDEPFCTSTYDGPIPGCKPNLLCQYKVIYGDGSSTSGYFVKDYVHLDQVVGNLQTAKTNGSVIFGCGAKQAGGLGSTTEALDGIIGFGQADSSMISQLASSGKVKKVFSHCLDGTNGGGIFAIGEVVQPKVKTTPLVPHQAHYNAVLKGIDVGGKALNLPSGPFGTDFERAAIIDSGSTLAYLPDSIYVTLLNKVMSTQPGLKMRSVEEQFTCFQYDGNVDDEFQPVTFHFEGSLALTVLPHEYLFQIENDMWCVGWQSSGLQSTDGKDVILLGDLALQNKLVVYDLESLTIGWTNYNCSSGIKLKDDKSGGMYAVGAHDIASASNLVIGRILTSLLVVIALTHTFIH